MDDIVDKLPNTPYTVAAKFQKVVTAKGEDGYSMRFEVSDGSSAAPLKASVSDTDRQAIGDAALERVDAVEAAVENRSTVRITA